MGLSDDESLASKQKFTFRLLAASWLTWMENNLSTTCHENNEYIDSLYTPFRS